jgi:hypoxanthine-DNA glycosylase
MTIITHPFKPVIEKDSCILILGTIPSPKSRENGFYYAHPQNCFWSVLAEVFHEPLASTDLSSKIAFLKKHKIAIWDVLHSCEISGSSDSSIKKPVANKFRPLLENSDVKAIFTNGKKATTLFTKLCEKEAGMAARYLPSTSPANRARYNKSEFLELWSLILEFM